MAKPIWQRNVCCLPGPRQLVRDLAAVEDTDYYRLCSAVLPPLPHLITLRVLVAKANLFLSTKCWPGHYLDLVYDQHFIKQKKYIIKHQNLDKPILLSIIDIFGLLFYLNPSSRFKEMHFHLIKKCDKCWIKALMKLDNFLMIEQYLPITN